MRAYIHSTVEIAGSALVGEGSKVWALCQIRENAVIGKNCIIGRNVFVDEGVLIGDNCKVQNNALLYQGVTLEEGVFIGPAVCFTNDKRPRAINPDGSLKSAADWIQGKTLVKSGAAVGAGAVIVTGITLGRFCLIGSGAVVTRTVPDFGLVTGNPARLAGYVCRDASRLRPVEGNATEFECPACSRRYRLEGAALVEL